MRLVDYFAVGACIIGPRTARRYTFPWKIEDRWSFAGMT
jgi:hypothetical protein